MKNKSEEFVTTVSLAAAIGHTRAIVTRALRKLHALGDPRVSRIGPNGPYVVSAADAPSIIAELRAAKRGAPRGARDII